MNYKKNIIITLVFLISNFIVYLLDIISTSQINISIYVILFLHFLCIIVALKTNLIIKIIISFVVIILYVFILISDITLFHAPKYA